MSMYECENCGSDDSTFPELFLAANTFSKGKREILDRHDNLFEKKFGEICEEVYKKNNSNHEHDQSEIWDKFWAWLGEIKISWFCSKECAIEYIQNNYVVKYL